MAQKIPECCRLLKFELGPNNSATWPGPDQAVGQAWAHANLYLQGHLQSHSFIIYSKSFQVVHHYSAFKTFTSSYL